MGVIDDSKELLQFIYDEYIKDDKLWLIREDFEKKFDWNEGRMRLAIEYLIESRIVKGKLIYTEFTIHGIYPRGIDMIESEENDTPRD